MSSNVYLLGECNRVMCILELAADLPTSPVEQLREARKSIKAREPPPPGKQDPPDLVALKAQICGFVDEAMAQHSPHVNLCLHVHAQVAAIARKLM